MIVVGIDVGGTFTDLTAVELETGAVQVTKVPSTPGDEVRAVLKGLELIAAGHQVSRIVHGTTVATNAILQRRGARVALVTTAGFRDLVEIGRTKRNIPALFNPTFVRPKPPVLRRLRFEVRERILHDGTVLCPVDETEVKELCLQMMRQAPEAFAVCFLHSYANPVHERRVGEWIRRAFPGLPVSLSSEVVPEYREFERFSTTALNAYVQPLMERYLDSLEKEVVASGYRTGVLTLGSNGGALTVAAARRLPIKTIFSGPAGGVSQAVFVGRRVGLADLITYDMGGTSTDVCLVRNLSPVITTENLVAAFPVKTPQIDIKSVGAGGGSIAWVDVDGSLEVGPQSAGADPGPACYGLGGREATVTDANLLLGRIGVQQLLGGVIRLDIARAQEAISLVGGKLGGFDPYRLAEGIIRIAVARMTSSIREITIQRGHDPRDFTLVAFGGAGPMHAIPVAEELGITRVLVPRFPGNFSALGVGASDIKHDTVRTQIGRLSDGALGVLRAIFSEMKAETERQLAAEGFDPPDRRFVFSLDLRYVGQAFELSVPVDPGTMTSRGIVGEFHCRHFEAYGHSNEMGEVEFVNLRLMAYGVVPKPDLPPYQSETVSLAEVLCEERRVYFHDSFVTCPVYQRERLPAGAAFDGPAIVEEFGATTVLFTGWHATLDQFGNLWLQRLMQSGLGRGPHENIFRRAAG